MTLFETFCIAREIAGVHDILWHGCLPTYEDKYLSVEY